MKIGDIVHVNTNLCVPMPDKFVIVGTRTVQDETWFALEDPKTGLQYAHFSPDELTLLSTGVE